MLEHLKLAAYFMIGVSLGVAGYIAADDWTLFVGNLTFLLR